MEEVEGECFCVVGFWGVDFEGVEGPGRGVDGEDGIEDGAGVGFLEAEGGADVEAIGGGGLADPKGEAEFFARGDGGCVGPGGGGRVALATGLGGVEAEGLGEGLAIDGDDLAGGVAVILPRFERVVGKQGL
jgi:hypothetical protein